MKTERLLQVTTALCVALGTILLGMGQRDMTMALLAIAGAILSVWLTDVVGLFRLNRLVASIIAIIASIFAFRCVFKLSFPPDPYNSIIAIAKLLVYLELILLFQKKNRRAYWQLLVLSLLQVVVATLLVQGGQFGLMMVIFMFVALLDLALLNLHTESLRASGHLQESKGWKRPKEMATTSRPRIRIPVRRDLFRQIFRMGIATLFLTTIVFFMMPRFGRSAWRGNFFNRPRSVGFNKVQLGQLGTVIDDPGEVLRLRLIDPKKPNRTLMRGEIYLHGTAFNQYKDRYWSHEFGRSRFRRRFRFRRWRSYGPHHRPRYRMHDQDLEVYPFEPLLQSYRRNRYTGLYSFFPNLYNPFREEPPESEEPEDLKRSPNVLLQEITVEPFERRELFGIRPYALEDKESRIEHNPETGRLLRSPSACRKKFSYRLYTTGIVNRYQRPFYAAEENIDMPLLLQLPEDIPSIAKTAKKWIDEANLANASPLKKAMHITRQLSNPGLFSYEMNSRRTDVDIDPIEDFVKNNPKGHCEYFATALALMLRSQEIPCRLVLGFKCNEYNSIGKFYCVRQLHAHTWVEVYLSAEESDLKNLGKKARRNGVWYRLDPTPVGSGTTSAMSKFFMPLAKFMNWFDSVWNDYIMEMDRARQKIAIYQPIVNWFKDTYHKITDPEWWIGVWEKTLPMLNPKNWNTEKWISWRGGLIGIAIMLTMVILFRIFRWGYRIIARRVRKIRAEKQRRRRVEVEFYRRFLLVTARWGLSRRQGQTSREFAVLAGPRIAETTQNHELEPLPAVITEAYYQVRFGQSPLDKDRQEEIELAVSRLEAAIEKT